MAALLFGFTVAPSCICERMQIDRPEKKTFEQRVNEALAAGNYGYAKAQFEAQNVTLAGLAPNQAGIDGALAAVKGVEGAGTITNKMFLARTYDVSFNRAGDKITLEGDVPSQKVKDQFGAVARTLASQIDNKLRVVKGAAYEGFDGVGTSMIQGLGFMRNGHFDMTKEKISVSGTVNAADRAKIEGLFGNLPSNFSIDGMNLLDADAVEKCDSGFSELLDKTQIRFKTGSALIDPRSGSLIKSLTGIAKDCPGTIAISGHTDSTGDASKNQALSEARANAVKTAFIEAGIDEKNLSAKGYGQTQPIGDNDTNEGRAKNRRIEMKVTF